jgi:hypothetical protein
VLIRTVLSDTLVCLSPCPPRAEPYPMPSTMCLGTPSHCMRSSQRVDKRRRSLSHRQVRAMMAWRHADVVVPRDDGGTVEVPPTPIHIAGSATDPEGSTHYRGGTTCKATLHQAASTTPAAGESVPAAMQRGGTSERRVTDVRCGKCTNRAVK